MVPWVERPTIDIDMDTPITAAYMEQFPEALSSSRQLLGFIRSLIPPAARYLAYAVRLRTANRFHREITSLAKLVEADWRDVMLANISYDLFLTQVGCSTVALPTPDGPVVARNMDWWPEDLLARASYLIQGKSGGKLCFSSAGWPGATGVVTGLSARGFALVLNAVSSPEGYSKRGYPVLLHLRRVLQDAPDFDSALKMLTKQRLFAPALITLVGIRNDQRVVIERTPTRHSLRWAEPDQPLVTTNHYRLMFQPATYDDRAFEQSTCSRYAALCRFFSSHSAKREVTDEELLYALADGQVIQNITAQHIIMRPKTLQIRLFVPRRFLSNV